MELIKSWEELKRRLVELVGKGRPVVICLGNELRGDDSVGVYIYRELIARGFKNVASCEDDLITCIYEILVEGKPTTLIIIDALDLKLSPGTIVTAYLEEVGEQITQLSTHKLPLTTVVKLLQEVSMYEFKTYVIGVQIGDDEPGKPMSEEVLKAANTVIRGLEGLKT